ncbi:MAG: hypothetical protein ACQEWV_21655 [Bacillota bacterium]
MANNQNGFLHLTVFHDDTTVDNLLFSYWAYRPGLLGFNINIVSL